MDPTESTAPHQALAAQFDAHEGRGDGTQRAASLAAGLGLLGDLMLARISTDPDRRFGIDSMLAPLSRAKSEALARTEIELYAAVESDAAARSSHYVRTPDEWYRGWLIHLRLGAAADKVEVTERLARYASQTADGRRMSFESAVEKILPEASRAPLVLYRLFPLAVAVATALAFGDQAGAGQSRTAQSALLPNLADCPDCRGRVLDNGERCPQCGNPLWKFDWLTAE